VAEHQTSEHAVQERAKATEAQKEAAKKRLADEKAAREKIAQDAPEAPKPTPTQEENDLAALGVHVPEHEPDGSPLQDPFAQQLEKQTKQAEAKKPATAGQYQTRATRPADTA